MSWVLLAALVPLVAGCSGFAHMEFRQDKRLSIEAPKNLSKVHVPFQVRWRMSDFTPTTSGPPSEQRGQFAVFMDRYPMPPGKGLHNIVDSLASCRGGNQCLQPQFLQQQFGIYVTTHDSVTVDYVPAAAATDGGDSQFLTIVLVDSAGDRIGESVWYVSFQVAS